MWKTVRNSFVSELRGRGNTKKKEKKNSTLEHDLKINSVLKLSNFIRGRSQTMWTVFRPFLTHPPILVDSGWLLLNPPPCPRGQAADPPTLIEKNWKKNRILFPFLAAGKAEQIYIVASILVVQPQPNFDFILFDIIFFCNICCSFACLFLLESAEYAFYSKKKAKFEYYV